MKMLDAYKKLNNSFKKKLVFNLGSEMGFYSEFNNMVFAILYCLKYQYTFVLYTAGANFKFKDGWTDYFEPFCSSTNFSFHSKYNKRIVEPILSRRDLPLLYLYRWLHPKTYFTYELWDKFYNANFEQEYFDIPALGIKGNLKEAATKIVEIIYRYNEKTKKEIQLLSDTLNLPAKYAGVNIRRGDKDTEFKFISIDAYMTKLKEVSNLNNVFLLTDDYITLAYLKKTYPQMRFYSFVDEDEKGYVHNNFIKSDSGERKKKMIQLFTSIELLCGADKFVGAFTANPGLFIAMRLDESKVYSVQKSSWYQFELDDVKDDVI